jgi:hypothetical protein
MPTEEKRMQKRKLLALAAIAALAAVPAAQAHTPSAPGWKVVASGLDNPRGIAIAKNGDLWIAEAGTGGAGPCAIGGEGAEQCFGTTGAFTLVHHGWQKRVVTGLPSLADKGAADGTGAGAGAVGPSDIIVNGNHVTGLIGGGANPANRASYGPGGAISANIVKIDPWKGTVWPFADLLSYEVANNPDDGTNPDGSALIDSDPNGIAQVHGGFVVADAAGNDVLGVSYHKHISTLATFAPMLTDAPPFLPVPTGTKIPYEAVPTTVAVRPKDHNLYVGQLTGFPFPAGSASVFWIKPDGTTGVYATGFTTIEDIAWGPKGSLYVLELTTAGLAAQDPGPGALIRVWPNGQKTTVASTGLSFPTSVAIARNGDVFVTNNGTSPGIGEVLDLGKV